MFRNFFTEHTVQVIPRDENAVADSLATAAGKFEDPAVGKKKYKVDIVNRPSILDNTKYWQVFENDMQIKMFMELSDEFVNTHIDEGVVDPENFLDVEDEGEEAIGTGTLMDSLGGRDIVQLKRNDIPRGLIHLESLFDQNDVARDPKVELSTDAVKDVDIGTEGDPKIVKLSKKFPTKEKEGYANLMKNYTDVFAWSYEYLKEYDTSIIHHTIAIKLGEKPFSKKIQRINPKVVPIIEKEVKRLFNAKIIVTMRFSKWVAIWFLYEKRMWKYSYVWISGI